MALFWGSRSVSVPAHVLAGADHLLFLLVVLADAVGARRGWRHALALLTSFTLGHGLTLAATALGGLTLPASRVEPAIAATIVLMALFSLWQRWRAARSTPGPSVVAGVHLRAGARARLGRSAEGARLGRPGSRLGPGRLQRGRGVGADQRGHGGGGRRGAVYGASRCRSAGGAQVGATRLAGWRPSRASGGGSSDTLVMT